MFHLPSFIFSRNWYTLPIYCFLFLKLVKSFCTQDPSRGSLLFTIISIIWNNERLVNFTPTEYFLFKAISWHLFLIKDDQKIAAASSTEVADGRLLCLLAHPKLICEILEKGNLFFPCKFWQTLRLLTSL